MNREIKFRTFSTKTETMRYNNPRLSNHSDDYLVEEENWKLMQYTGLKDKNGQEIYEGDIVRSYEKVATIIWLESEVGFYARTLTGECFKYAHNSIIEIIGNIYENQELLSGN